ncbi:hypothetical protein [Endozoicomonas sp. ONNA2]|uniref:hypothetical protein n=1 Tax=Endozoicomonas sp. ONNA2 TaxID=2828741 RepID=UPI00214757AA|nr:hypothetical protein [Endozoicomonas sp. ONNA2]
MDSVYRNALHYTDGQKLGIGTVDNEAAAGARQTSDIGGVEGKAIEGLKSAVAKAFLSDSFVRVKLRSIVGLPMDDFRKMSGKLKKATKKSDREAQEKIARDYVEEVFAKAKNSKEMLIRIKEATGLQGSASTKSSVSTSPVATDSVNKAESRKRALGNDQAIGTKPLKRAKTETSTVSETEGNLQNETGPDQQCVSASEEPPLKIPNEDYIRSLDDTDLIEKRSYNLEYDMGTGRYLYDTAMIHRCNRPYDANFAIRLHPGSQSVHGQNGTALHPGFVPEILRTGSESDCEPFRNGDALAIITFKQFDKHALNMSFLLKSLDLAIHSLGLPEGLQELAIKVAVTDGYRASVVLRVFKVEDGFSSRMQSDPDNVVAADNLLRITFNQKSDMAELFAVASPRSYKATGKTLGELEHHNQVTLILESTCAEAIQGTIMNHCRSLPSLSSDRFISTAQKVSSKIYTFEDGAFKGP